MRSCDTRIQEGWTNDLLCVTHVVVDLVLLQSFLVLPHLQVGVSNTAVQIGDHLQFVRHLVVRKVLHGG